MNLKDYIRSVPNYPKKGILFRDITTLIKNEKAFRETINRMVARLNKYSFDKVTAIESRGFIFASAISFIMEKPFILLRKKNKLPYDLGGSERLIKNGYRVEKLIEFPGH